MLERSKLNFLVDAAMFLCMMAIAGLGFLMKFVLPPGRERVEKYGNVELSLLGMDRHEWGTVHLYIAFFLLGLLSLHIALHWKAILALFGKLVHPSSRRIAAPAFLAVSALLVIGPLLARPTIRALGPAGATAGDGCLVEVGGVVTACGGCDEAGPKAGESPAAGELDPALTLDQISAGHNMPVFFLKKSLGIPETTPGDARLRDLQNIHGFHLEDVTRILENYDRLRKRQGPPRRRR